MEVTEKEFIKLQCVHNFNFTSTKILKILLFEIDCKKFVLGQILIFLIEHLKNK